MDYDLTQSIQIVGSLGICLWIVWLIRTSNQYVNDDITESKNMIKKKTKLELALDNCNHTMELVRTLVPILILIIQIIILFKI